MNIRQLEIFRAVMMGGSASRAAELLQITQPAVSRAVAELEDNLGFFLFDRVKGRLVPTPEGILFFRDVNDSFIGLDRIRSSAARIRDFGLGTIRIASQAALGSTLVPRAIHAFRQVHPDVAITLQVLSSATVRDYVMYQQFDIGLAAEEVDLSGVEHRLFGNFRAVCALPPGHVLADKDIIRPEDLDGLPFIALSPEDRLRAQLTTIFDEAGVKPQVVVETPYALTVCALVLAGVGVGIVNLVAAEGFPERGLILKPFEPEIYFRSYLLFRPDTQKAQVVNRFVGALLRARSYNRTLMPK
ncbi:LysR substrate-binding domain-containing protein [Asticcacaulis machinosus]|uniref:LysR substrate-binding domain-containing protein n=1 Tax=Asticcacaulis machinosus TaxID=2984211 RepID=A0ABT5HMI0_9CAUL|nr:LysR substrate-binding domain-containing protein [Asticcacaulis machinosus]MDC7677451.1 LysR substrate-binding domain-containing protein [Asticcacaulis machinosus]